LRAFPPGHFDFLAIPAAAFFKLRVIEELAFYQESAAGQSFRSEGVLDLGPDRRIGPRSESD
jgi:hypothetical protein